MTRFLFPFILLQVVCVPSAAEAFEGRYRIQGVGPEGSYRGSARIQYRSRRWQVQLRTIDAKGNERRADARGGLSTARAMRFTCRAQQVGHVREAALRVRLRSLQSDPTSLIATYRNRRRKVVRRECWLRDDLVRIPVQIVSLAGSAKFPDVSPSKAREAQARILAQLNTVYSKLQVQFQPITTAPARIKGAAFDADGNGRLSKKESRALRDALARSGLKRPGRVVIVITAAGFVSRGCRGWTLGDAPASPDTLWDPNDNFSLVGIRYLHPGRYHTVAHEVGHQLGLDDVRPQNRHRLRQPRRRDHLMISGGTGLHLDPVLTKMLHRTCARFPDHGLEGRREDQKKLLSAPRIVGKKASGLPQPKLLKTSAKRPARGR